MSPLHTRHSRSLSIHVTFHRPTRELNEWKTRREAELQQQENEQTKGAHERMKEKVQSEIDLVARKLNEERREKLQKIARERAERDRVSVGNNPGARPIPSADTLTPQQAAEEKHAIAINRLEKELEQAAKEHAALQKKESEESNMVEQMETKLSDLKDALLDKEDEVALLEQKLETLAKESEEKSADALRDGERMLAKERSKVNLLEKELDNLAAELPNRQAEKEVELNSLRESNAEEIAVAEVKIGAMLDRKQATLDEVSAKLLCLRQEASDLEREMDEARKAKLQEKLEQASKPKRTRKAPKSGGTKR